MGFFCKYYEYWYENCLFDPIFIGYFMKMRIFIDEKPLFMDWFFQLASDLIRGSSPCSNQNKTIINLMKMDLIFMHFHEFSDENWAKRQFSSQYS